MIFLSRTTKLDFPEKSLVIPFVLDIRTRRNEKIHRQLQTCLSEWSYAPNTAVNNLNQTIWERLSILKTLLTMAPRLRAAGARPFR